jgi:hypothetical protein
MTILLVAYVLVIVVALGEIVVKRVRRRIGKTN